MTNDQYTALTAWIAEQEPGQTAEQLHAALHAKTLTRTVSQLATWAGIAAVLTDAEYDEAQAATAWLATLSARNADMLARLGGEWGLDLGHPDIRAALDGAVAAGKFAAATAAKIKAIAEEPCSAAQSLGIPATLLDVIRAQREVQS